LRPLRQFRFPIEVECISPDIFQSKTCSEIESLEVWEGNRQKRLKELFKIEEIQSKNQEGNTTITINGDVSEVRRIGLAMTTGEIVVNGNAGMHLGEKMKGGKITVHGSVGGWTGSMMKGGEIEVLEDAGDYLGAPYRGSNEGMRGGRITIHGNVGGEAGAYMKKGLIRICGSVGQFAGFRMREGTIQVKGDCAGRAGACMVGGKIVVEGFLGSILPTFTIDSIKQKVKVEEGETIIQPFYLFLGDLAEDGDGKLYVLRKMNPQFSHYEEML
jgi:formylmethanofuran dehydrogenase subunit C